MFWDPQPGKLCWDRHNLSTSPLLVNFDPGVSPLGQKIEKLIKRSTVVSRCDKLGWRAADRVCCEKQAAAWSETASVVNYLCFAVIGDRMWGYTPVWTTGVLVIHTCR